MIVVMQPEREECGACGLSAAKRPRQLAPQPQTSIKISQRGTPDCNPQSHSWTCPVFVERFGIGSV